MFAPPFCCRISNQIALTREKFNIRESGARSYGNGSQTRGVLGVSAGHSHTTLDFMAALMRL